MYKVTLCIRYIQGLNDFLPGWISLRCIWWAILYFFSPLGVRFDHAKIHLKSLNHLYKAGKKFFKLCLVGTLNLCLKAPEQMQKTRNQSVHPWLRKRPKTVKNWSNSIFANFRQFFGVFSTSSFQACWDTTLEYPQGILWRILSRL